MTHLRRHLVPGSMVLLAALALLGCAGARSTARTDRVRHADIGYTDQRTFWVNHRGAYAEGKGPSSGVRTTDGELSGRVCGADLNFRAVYQGSQMRLQGFIRPHLEAINEQSVRLEVRDRKPPEGRVIRDFTGSVGVTNDVGLATRPSLAAARRITSTPRLIPQEDPAPNAPLVPTLSLGALTSGNPSIDMQMSAERLRGRVGSRTYDLTRQDDDRYAGTVTLPEKTHAYEIRGADKFWTMPPADQATIMLLMLSCSETSGTAQGIKSENDATPILTVDLTSLKTGTESVTPP